MKIKWLVADLTAVGCRKPLLSSNKFTQGHSMKLKRLVADVTAVRFPDRAQHAIIWVILARRFFDNSDYNYGWGATL